MEVDENPDTAITEMSAKSGTSVEQNPLKDRAVVEKVKQRVRDDKRDRKKDDKSVEHVLKALNSLETTEEKLAAMCKKYADIFNDHRMLQNMVKQAEKKCSLLQREKEQLQTEHSKAILTKSTLENLCRELQRQNKVVKEESMMRIREEEEKRKEVSAKFQSTLSEITAMMQANNDKNTKLRDDNIDMTQKLKSVYEQYERREQHVEKLAKQMQLEVQLAEAKLAKAKMEMAVEKETLLREKQQLLIEIAEYKSRLEEMQGTEQSLRTQITLYNNKYDEFHRALIQSNEAISGFKAEMDRMSKQIRRLERETGAWRGRYEGTHAALSRMTEEKLRLEGELGTAGRKMAALHRLCHTLQDNRRAAARGESILHSEAALKAQMDEVKALEECPTKSATVTLVEGAREGIVELVENGVVEEEEDTEGDRRSREVEIQCDEVVEKSQTEGSEKEETAAVAAAASAIEASAAAASAVEAAAAAASAIEAAAAATSAVEAAAVAASSVEAAAGDIVETVAVKSMVETGGPVSQVDTSPTERVDEAPAEVSHVESPAAAVSHVESPAAAATVSHVESPLAAAATTVSHVESPAAAATTVSHVESPAAAATVSHVEAPEAAVSHVVAPAAAVSVTAATSPIEPSAAVTVAQAAVNATSVSEAVTSNPDPVQEVPQTTAPTVEVKEHNPLMGVTNERLEEPVIVTVPNAVTPEPPATNGESLKPQVEPGVVTGPATKDNNKKQSKNSPNNKQTGKKRSKNKTPVQQ